MFVYSRSYRKVAADKCTMGNKDFVSRVHPDVDATCPVVKPGGLDVTMSSKQAAVTRKSVVFHLTQEMVSAWSLCGHSEVTLWLLCGHSEVTLCSVLSL